MAKELVKMDKSVALELGKMRSLIERMEGKFTPYQALLNEERLINEATMEISRRPAQLVNSSSEMFEFLDSIVKFDRNDPNRATNNKHAFITMGYVSDVKLNTTVKKKNPLTNRQKTYNDYSVIGENIASIVCVTYYNYNYCHRSYVKYDYGHRYVAQRNALRTKYGIPLPKPKPGYDDAGNPNGEPTEVMPKNQSLVDQFGDDYNPQNLCNIINRERLYYPIDLNGRVLRGEDGKPMCIKENEIKKFLAAEDPVEGVTALRKLGAEQSVIDQYANEFKNLKMIYKNFRADSILSIRGKDANTGDLKIFINPNINKIADDIPVNPRDLYEIAYDRYKKPIEKGEES
jgi:hypothetical protein